MTNTIGYIPAHAVFTATPRNHVLVPHAVVTKYQKRISGPLLDRIDIHIEVPRVDYEKLSGERVGEPSECICARVQAARDIQTKRFGVRPRSVQTSDSIVCNADMRVGKSSTFVSCRKTPKA